jgi:hypothetical protein
MHCSRVDLALSGLSSYPPGSAFGPLGYSVTLPLPPALATPSSSLPSSSLAVPDSSTAHSIGATLGHCSCSFFAAYVMAPMQRLRDHQSADAVARFVLPQLPLEDSSSSSSSHAHAKAPICKHILAALLAHKLGESAYAVRQLRRMDWIALAAR